MKSFGRLNTGFVVNISQESLTKFALILRRVRAGLAL
jgi:hypothetical protein